MPQSAKITALTPFRNSPLTIWLRLHYQLEQILITNLRITLAGHRDFLRLFLD
jgi:hypothetical protein